MKVKVKTKNKMEIKIDMKILVKSKWEWESKQKTKTGANIKNIHHRFDESSGLIIVLTIQLVNRLDKLSRQIV